MPTINISDDLYARLGSYAVGFEQPESVIERVLNEYDKVMGKKDPVIVTHGSLDKRRILRVHDELFQFLIDHKIVFMPRQKTSDRLNQGYWFIGDNNYLAISFYTGNDTSNKTPNITFQMYLSEFYLGVLNRQKSPIPLSTIQLSNTVGSAGWSAKEPVMNEIRKRLGGFECNRVTDGIESRWNRYYENRSYNDVDYLKCLEEFLTKDKPIIDEVIRDAKNSEIGFLDQNKADRKIYSIARMRKLIPH
jgi:hypothetical protein